MNLQAREMAAVGTVMEFKGRISGNRKCKNHSNRTEINFRVDDILEVFDKYATLMYCTQVTLCTRTVVTKITSNLI